VLKQTQQEETTPRPRERSHLHTVQYTVTLSTKQGRKFTVSHSFEAIQKLFNLST